MTVAQCIRNAEYRNKGSMTVMFLDRNGFKYGVVSWKDFYQRTDRITTLHYSSIANAAIRVVFDTISDNWFY